MSGCARHHNRCAYPEPDNRVRCPFCHRAWATITGYWHYTETVEEHWERHRREDAVGAERAARREQGRHSRHPAQPVTHEQPLPGLEGRPA